MLFTSSGFATGHAGCEAMEPAIGRGAAGAGAVWARSEAVNDGTTRAARTISGRKRRTEAPAEDKMSVRKHPSRPEIPGGFSIVVSISVDKQGSRRAAPAAVADTFHT